MKFKIIILLFVTLFYYKGNQSYAVNLQIYKQSIKGIVVDTTTKQPIEYVSIAIYNSKNNTLISGTTTDRDGIFNISDIKIGKYILKSSSVGYKTRTKIIHVDSILAKNIDTIYLLGSSIQLADISITAHKNEKQVSIEKTKINVSQNALFSTGNVIDILKNQPSISIDADNKIYLRGSENLLILIDGHPTTLTSLSSIPSAGVENIEIISNPDAKYDAEGTAGIININTRKESLAGYSALGSFNYGIKNNYNGNIGISFSKNIWNFGLTYNLKNEQNNVSSSLTRELLLQQEIYQQSIASEIKNPVHSLNFNISMTPKGYQISNNFKYFSNEITNLQEIIGNQTNRQNNFKQSYSRKNDISWTRKIYENSFSYKKFIEKGIEELSTEFIFSRTNGNRPANYYVNDIFQQKSEGGGNPTNTSLQIDYFKYIRNFGKIECGGKFFSRWNNFETKFYDKDTINNIWNINSQFSSDLKHKEYIYSSYIMYSDSLTKNFFYKVGLRSEYNTSDLKQNSTSEQIKTYNLILFPYLLLKYSLTKEQNIALAFSRRVTRPTYPQLNPVLLVHDQITYECGNKNLKYETTDKVEINYSITNNKYQISTGLFFNSTQNYITQISLLSSIKNLIVTYVNGSRSNKTGLLLDANYKFNNTFSIASSLSSLYSDFRGNYKEINLSNNSFSWTGNLNFSANFDAKTSMQFIFNYNSPTKLPQFDLSEIYYSDLTFKRTIYKSINLNLTISDLFNTRKWEVKSSNSIYKLENSSKNNTRIYWIGISANFNSYKIFGNSQNNNNENNSSIIQLGQ